MTDRQKLEVKKLWKVGWSIAKIAKKLKLKAQEVYEIVQ